MAKIRTLNFLPEIFKTDTNAQFLGATLDQLVNPPVTEKLQGYVGSKFGYGVNAREFTKEEVLEQLKEFSDNALKWEEVNDE